MIINHTIKQMNTNKIKEMFKGKRKTENLIVLVIILIVTVIAINYIWKDNKEISLPNTKNASNNAVEVMNNVASNDETETKLEKILSNIEGVGKVKVMITYSESSKVEPIYNQNNKSSNTTENDNDGGTRTISEEDSQKEIIYKEKSDGTKEPITQSIISPKIEGTIIAAQGAGNDNVKANIIQAVEAATGLATHKIQVFKMEVQN